MFLQEKGRGLGGKSRSEMGVGGPGSQGSFRTHGCAVQLLVVLWAPVILLVPGASFPRKGFRVCPSHSRGLGPAGLTETRLRVRSRVLTLDLQFLPGKRACAHKTLGAIS